MEALRQNEAIVKNQEIKDLTLAFENESNKLKTIFLTLNRAGKAAVQILALLLHNF